MKALIGIMGMALVMACGTSKDIEVNFVNAELVKIDTVYRYPNTYQQVLTWRSSESNVQYVSYSSMHNTYALGSRMVVMVKR